RRAPSRVSWIFSVGSRPARVNSSSLPRASMASPQSGSMIAAGTVHMVLVVTGQVGRLHLQLQAYQVGGLRAQQQVGVLGVALLHVHADQQLLADRLDPPFLALPDDSEAGA